jgi:hypothetical protein
MPGHGITGLYRPADSWVKSGSGPSLNEVGVTPSWSTCTYNEILVWTERLVWERATKLAPADRLAPYVAHMSLRRVDWTIRHHSAEDVTLLLDLVANQRARLNI